MDTNITHEQAETALKNAKSMTEWGINLGFTYLNGRVSKILHNLIAKYNLDCSHFDRWHVNRKYQIMQKTCPICQKQFETKLHCKKEKTVCSLSCSNVFLLPSDTQ
jgi:hypothetical protein